MSDPSPFTPSEPVESKLPGVDWLVKLADTDHRDAAPTIMWVRAVDDKAAYAIALDGQPVTIVVDSIDLA